MLACLVMYVAFGFTIQKLLVINDNFLIKVAITYRKVLNPTP